MANWAADWELRNPELAGKPLLRHRHGITAHLNASERVSHFVGAPVHYLDNGVWQPLDTKLLAIGAEYGAPGLATRLSLDGSVRIDGKPHGHRSNRIGVLDGNNYNFSHWKTIPDGLVDDDRIVAESGIWQRVLTMTETGLREEIVIAEKPSIPGVKLTDWLVLETQIAGSTFADGWLDEFETAGVRFPLPHAHDANDNRAADCKRYARTVGGVQYLYTGVPVSWLAAAVYPVTIDPDYAATTADGYVEGSGSYATAHSTSASYLTNIETLFVGQKPTYYIDRGFLKFNTSAIPDTYVISQVNLKLVCTNDYSTTDFDVQIVKQNWSGQDPLSDANREAAYDGCLAGTADDSIWRNTNGMSVETVYTSGNLATDWPSKTGYTYYSLISSRDKASTTPTGNEWIKLAAQDNATAGYRPLLAVTHAERKGFRLLLGVGV